MYLSSGYPPHLIYSLISQPHGIQVAEKIKKAANFLITGRLDKVHIPLDWATWHLHEFAIDASFSHAILKL